MLAQKFRPRRFTDMVGQQLIKENLMAQSKKGAWSQVYILGGQYGSGKTTAARIISMAVNCHEKDANGNPCGRCESCRSILTGNCPDILEVDAASNTGIDNIRRIIDLSSYAPTVADKRVFIIDEVHRLSAAAFESLLKILEEPPAHCLFVLATTDVEKIPATVRSRACKYTFGRIPEKLISEHIAKVARVEKISITKEACDTIARASDGALRNALMNLERVSFSCENIDAEAVRAIIGASDEVKVGRLLCDMARFDMEAVVNAVHTFSYGGKNLYTLSGEMLDVCGDIILSSCGTEITASETYLDMIHSFEGGLKKAAKLSEQLLEVREHTRDNASEGVFLSLLMRAVARLEAEFSPKKMTATTPATATVEADPEPYMGEGQVETAAEETVPATATGCDVEDLFGGLDDISIPEQEQKCAPAVSDDPFDAFADLQEDVPTETVTEADADDISKTPVAEERSDVYPFKTGRIVEKDGKRFIMTEDVNFPVEISDSGSDVPFEENEADSFPKKAVMLNAEELKGYPEFLRRPLDGCTKEVAQAISDLIGICKQEPELIDILGSFKCDTKCGIVCLETDDRLAFRQAASIVRDYDIQNVDFVSA